MRIGRLSVLFVLMVMFMAAAAPAGAPDPVLDAARQGDVKALKALIAKGADVNHALGDGMTALHFAAERNDAEAATVLIKAGAKLDAGTRIGGHTPLHVASKAGSAETVTLLVEHGADVEAEESEWHQTPPDLRSRVEP